jgi:menaquinol-cytochrome c reductase iron-sulfur subunit
MSQEPACCEHAQDRPPDGAAPRRWFIAILAGAVGFIAGIVPLLVSVLSFLDPINRREKKFTDPKKPAGQKTDDGFVRVAALAELPANGEPLRVQVRDDVTNKWTFTPNEPVGEVFLLRAPEGNLTAFTTVCTHEGCSISLRKDDNGNQIFKCPCHNGTFEMNGKLIAGPPPRDMDKLECFEKDGQVYVKYQTFYANRDAQVARN